MFSALQSAGWFTPPASQSPQEANLAAQAFGRNSDDVVLLYTSKDITVHPTAYKSAVGLIVALVADASIVAMRISGGPTGGRRDRCGAVRQVRHP